MGCTDRHMGFSGTLETKAWRSVRGVITEPEELTRDLDRMIELKREGERGDPQRQAGAETPTKRPASLEEDPGVCRTRVTPRSARTAAHSQAYRARGAAPRVREVVSYSSSMRD